MVKKLKKFELVIVVRVKAPDDFVAMSIGESMVDHLLEIFNDDESLVQVYAKSVTPQD
jgi:hypothetical protein